MASPSDSSFEASRRALHDLLNDLHDIDLTGDIDDESLLPKAYGGYCDMFVGKARRHGETKLVIKRLRVYTMIMMSEDIDKVRLQ